MRKVVWGLFFLMGLLLCSPAIAGTGGAEDPAKGAQDADQALRTAIRWILTMKGFKVVQSERTADLNEYYIDQRNAGASAMKAISDGLSKRKWKVNSKQDAKKQVLEASKDDKRLTVSLAKSGAEPRLTLEIRRVGK
jgi:hypothetical protein